MVADVNEPDFRSDLRSYGFGKKRFINEICQRLQLLSRVCMSLQSQLSQLAQVDEMQGSTQAAIVEGGGAAPKG